MSRNIYIRTSDSVKVRAVQFNGENAEEINKIAEGVFSSDKVGDYLFDESGEGCPVDKGSWIVNCRGVLSIVSNRSFKKKYEIDSGHMITAGETGRTICLEVKKRGKSVIELYSESIFTSAKGMISKIVMNRSMFGFLDGEFSFLDIMDNYPDSNITIDLHEKVTLKLEKWMDDQMIIYSDISGMKLTYKIRW